MQSMKELLEIKNSSFKNQKEMADFIGVSQGSLSDWLSGEKRISPNNAKKIEKLFGIPRELLRPDIYGN
jgi:DNA-binding transcriptional regulator YdaS (Cro superfamily)